ncbi:carbohydrate ABC transporter permease [Anaeromicropila herbilytica]|uniref:Sugar ABC transporter permease n=1 Tax=Anaeromicropila herbilytica TaxID=2785025 RepID=A0A7R7EKL8_9FIRM|nr:carbohydrate ABC transporter permease [Anaeromicropila herbilytica]BCN30611.1 sugar ABC transporter permease [Anaeromicropila herbilytica]
MCNERKISKFFKIIIGLFVAALFLFPMFMLLLASFKSQKNIFLDVIGWPKPIVLTNYGEAMKRMDYGSALWNLLWITIVATIIIIIFTSMASWVLVRYKTRVSKVLFYVFAISMLIPFQCVMLPLMSTLSKLDLLNPKGLIFAYLGFGSPLSIILYHGFIKGIPAELEEAAAIDGCSMFRTFWGVVFPLLSPITMTVAILNIMWIWNDYLLPSLVIGSNVQWNTLPLKTFFFFGQFSSRWDYASAGLIMSIIPIIIFYLAAQKKIIKGVVDGAIK